MFRGGQSPAGGEDTLRARLDHGFERFFQIAGYIKRAVEGYGKGMRQVDQPFRSLDIHFAIGIQEPENDSIHAELLGRPNVILHDFKLRSGVHKIARSWPNDDVNGQTKMFAGDFHQAGAGSNPARGEVAAKLDAMSSAALRRHGAGN
jgi:hypothetical protein